MKGGTGKENQVGKGKGEEDENGKTGETAKMKGHLRGSIEIQYGRSFLK